MVVYGAGAWGTAVALLAARQGAGVTLVCRGADQARAVGAGRENPAYLPGVRLPDAVDVTHTGAAEPALAAADVVVSALPSRVVDGAAPGVAAALAPGVGVVSLTKGLDPGSGRLLSQVWRDALGDAHPFCVLSGPNHAEEIARAQPATSVVAGDPALAERVQRVLSGGSFRLYTNPDMLGVELCGAAKNVVAIAAGIADGLGFGDNTKAGVITRGLAEMTRLGTEEGASAVTFRGLAGLGDLVATCTSGHSRNRRAGELIARGTAPGDVEGVLGQVAEGLWTVDRLLARAGARGVELPICAEVQAALAGKPVRECMADLMTRAPSSEHDGG